MIPVDRDQKGLRLANRDCAVELGIEIGIDGRFRPFANPRVPVTAKARSRPPMPI